MSYWCGFHSKAHLLLFRAIVTIGKAEVRETWAVLSGRMVVVGSGIR
jgi:hypothetical protein